MEGVTLWGSERSCDMPFDESGGESCEAQIERVGVVVGVPAASFIQISEYSLTSIDLSLYLG